MTSSTIAARGEPAEQPTALHTLRRGAQLSPELRHGLVWTLLLAAVATLGRVVVPFAVQQTIDRGVLAEGGPDVANVSRLLALAACVVAITAVAAYAVNIRLFRAAEG